MKKNIFKVSIAGIAIIFTLIFCLIVIPPLLKNPDILGALMAGFVNPYTAGYSSDVIACWFILAVWVIYESKQVKYGWVCLLLGLVPGVAVGFAGYLLLRANQLELLCSSN